MSVHAHDNLIVSYINEPNPENKYKYDLSCTPLPFSLPEKVQQKLSIQSEQQIKEVESLWLPRLVVGESPVYTNGCTNWGTICSLVTSNQG